MNAKKKITHGKKGAPSDQADTADQEAPAKRDISVKKGAPGKRTSIILTIQIGAYILVMLSGAGMTVLGGAGAVKLKLSLNGLELRAPSLGLELVAIGAFVSYLLSRQVAKGVQVFSPGNSGSSTERFVRIASVPMLLIAVLASIATIAVILLFK
jgi:hypothetical protein